ncbi:MAG: hypothetical protein ABIW76_07970, partial [Fibrobacteria bacterium]
MKTFNLNFAFTVRAIGSIFGIVLMVSCLEPADQIMATYGEGRIVFVKEPSVGGMNQNRNIAMASNPDEFHPGTDLVSLSPISPTGALTNLTAQWTRSRDNEGEWGAALDPEASFDGNKVLFSMRKAGPRYDKDHPRFTIYEMDADGTNLVQLTLPNGYDDMDPAYVDESHIVFASTKNQIMDEYERRIVPQLFVGERGPKGFLINIRQITFNQSHDQNPFLHSSGRIFYTRWDHLGGPNKMPLFSVNPDGTGQFVLYGADETFSGQGMGSGSRTFMEARELHDGGIVASLMERTSDYEGGAICIVDLSKFTSAPRLITPSTSPYNNTQKVSQALFKTPYPIMDGGVEKILVAESPNETGGDINGKVNYDLFIMDKNGGTPRLIHADPAYNDYDPVVIAPRSYKVKPFSVDSLVQKALQKDLKTGMFFDANVYSRQNDGQPSSQELAGRVKFVRVLAAVSTPNGCDFCGQTIGNTEFERQRVLGYADVRADSSFSIEVPANTPMHVQTLDENGMMLVNQLQWINVMPGEQRTCTGCHGVREKDRDIEMFHTRNDTVTFEPRTLLPFLSGFYNAQKVESRPSPAGGLPLNFFHLKASVDSAAPGTVQAVFDNRCNTCHSASEAASKGGNLVLENLGDTSYTNHGTTKVYERLTEGNQYVTAVANQKINYATDNGARQSPLAWVMLNKQLGGNKGQFKAPS